MAKKRYWNGVLYDAEICTIEQRTDGLRCKAVAAPRMSERKKKKETGECARGGKECAHAILLLLPFNFASVMVSCVQYKCRTEKDAAIYGIISRFPSLSKPADGDTCRGWMYGESK